MAVTPTGLRDPLELRDYLRVLGRRWLTIVFVTLVVTGLGYYLATNKTQTYESSSEVVLASDLTAPALATQQQIIESQLVHQAALKKVPHAVGVTTEQAGTANAIDVTATSADPTLAADSVNADVDAYIAFEQQRTVDQFVNAASDITERLNKVRQQILAFPPQLPPPAGTVGSGNPQLDALTSQAATLAAQLQALQTDTGATTDQVTVVTRAEPASTPTGTTTRQDVLIAFGAGLLLGIALAFLVEYLDDSIKTRDDLERATGNEVPVLGVIPAIRAAHHQVVALTAPRSAAAEAYRSLRTAVYFAGLDRGRCVEFTSARSREGTTQTVANLAVSVARAGQRVILVDANLRSPAVHRYFNLPNDVGFTSVVVGEPLSEAFQTVPDIDNLYVLTSGPVPPNPSELLASGRCRDVLNSLKADGTLVLVDTSALLPVTDAAALAASVDMVVLVTKARASARRQLRHAVQLLQQLGAPLAGVVLTRAGNAGEDWGSYRWQRRARVASSVPRDAAANE